MESQLRAAQEEIQRLRSDNTRLRAENLAFQTQQNAAEECYQLRNQYAALQADNQRLVFDIRSLRAQMGIHVVTNTEL
ncbi:uncharacterized protein ColSpa_09780 [Colletotrichum spaethianum]|uniref:Uncharacterized protein n=1 Tax=Colletotrichum spaethianum TaxID=700344 RepID=A0AA37PCC6_9PEZI|nr:uncharacterized protein ColSpa_09780 [Colletotrichum spaethianum]GKT49599.1 hypothetical protein ColSpa_09780 [Colletotrichum spaethianum]